MRMTDAHAGLIMCPPPEYGNPFAGSLILSGEVTLARNNLLAEQIQNYRNLRHNLLDRRNMWAVYTTRAVELAAERKLYESKLMRCINFLYEFSSGYGNVPERALGLTAALAAYNVLLIWLNKLYAVTIDCAGLNPSSWLVGLCRGDAWSGLVASVMLALQGLVNPFGLFMVENAVMPSNVPLTIWLWLSNIALVALLALVGVGVRRRMKD